MSIYKVPHNDMYSMNIFRGKLPLRHLKKERRSNEQEEESELINNNN